MLEAASPWGCRGELVPRGSSETDSVPLAPRSDPRWTIERRNTRTFAGFALLLNEASSSLPARPDDPSPRFAAGLSCILRLCGPAA